MKKVSISRRDFVRASGLTAAWAALTACGPVGAALWPQSEEPSGSGGSTGSLGEVPNVENAPTATPWLATDIPDDDALLVHTVRRMSYGMSPGQLAWARDLGLAAYIDEQLNPELIDDSQVKAMLAGFDVLEKTGLELFEEEQRGRQIGEFSLATVIRQRFSERQFFEAVVDLWTNHFNIYIRSGPSSLLKIIDDREVIRPFAFSTFPELLRASAHSPAMLTYLDQASSNREHPNENYARELLELHTVGVDGGYTQSDVQEAARALTGWSVVAPRGRFSTDGEPFSFIYRDHVHDDGAKQIMGMTLPAGGGESDGNILIDYLGAHLSTARYVSYKMAVRFVSDIPPASIIDAMAATYTETGGDIPAMLRTMLSAPEFAASVGQKMKRPLEFFVSALRATGAEVNGRARMLSHLLLQMGQIPFGWATPDGYPDYASWWTTTSGLLARWNFALMMLTEALDGVVVNPRALVADGESSEDIVDLLSLAFMGVTLPDDARSVLVDFASAGDLGDNIPLTAALLLGSPHFQVR